LETHLGLTDLPTIRAIGMAAAVPAALSAWILVADPGLGPRIIAVVACVPLSAGLGWRLSLRQG